MPTEILDKPGPLDDDEWEIIREHTVIGERMLRAVPEMGAVANMVRHSHESWDGSGYPDGLAGEEIPLASRIILCADAFHAIRSDRPYRAGRTADEALKEVQASAGRQFDPRVVEALVAVARDVRRANRAALPRPRRLAALLAALAVGGGSTAYAASDDVRHVVSDVVDKVVPGNALKTAEAEAAEDFSLRPIEEVPEIVPVAVLTPDLEFPALRNVAYDVPTYRGQSDDGFSTVALLDSEGLLDLATERRSHPVAPESPPTPEPQAAWPAPATPVVAVPVPAAPVTPSLQPVTATAPELLPVAEFTDPVPDETRKPTSNDDKKPEHPNGGSPGQEKDKEKDEQPSFEDETQTEPQDDQPQDDQPQDGPRQRTRRRPPARSEQEPPRTKTAAGGPREQPTRWPPLDEQPDEVETVRDDAGGRAASSWTSSWRSSRRPGRVGNHTGRRGRARTRARAAGSARRRRRQRAARRQGRPPRQARPPGAFRETRQARGPARPRDQRRQPGTEHRDADREHLHPRRVRRGAAGLRSASGDRVRPTARQQRASPDASTHSPA